MAQGRPLSADELEDARQVGVAAPERIRLMFVASIPTPARFLDLLGRWTGVVGQATSGLTLGYGIYIRAELKNDRGLRVHECVHVGQYERFGSIENFLRAYLRECLDPGYPWGVLEQEAVLRTRAFLRGV